MTEAMNSFLNQIAFTGVCVCLNGWCRNPQHRLDTCQSYQVTTLGYTMTVN